MGSDGLLWAVLGSWGALGWGGGAAEPVWSVSRVEAQRGAADKRLGWI